MKRTGWRVFGWALALAPLLIFALCGCEVGSADSVVRMVALDFSGFYQGYGSNGTQMVVPPNSGTEVTLLNLRQNGDQLEAIDNNGIVFRGTLGNLVDTTASFTLEGRTTVGQAVTISGTLNGSGTEGTMRGTWIEPSQYSTLSAKAVINPSPTNTEGEVDISPSSANLTANQQTQTFTASGGTESYTWGLLNTNGTLNTSSGSSVTYTRLTAGDNQITVSDTAGSSASADITQP
ncbi:MAG TPA: hypothetical protein P5567_10345 [Kiritimatiellia bacterium]|nr:hypothetical protein [Kiritimatiellia bacterium]HRZ12838.1 hypothetical protein [Kiritimatiellia bacterium]HSA18210.1 hypothetical protein [Kiritimatiellia bacterium]